MNTLQYSRSCTFQVAHLSFNSRQLGKGYTNGMPSRTNDEVKDK